MRCPGCGASPLEGRGSLLDFTCPACGLAWMREEGLHGTPPGSRMTVQVPGVSGFDLGVAVIRTLVHDAGATVLEYGVTAEGTEVELTLPARTKVGPLAESAPDGFPVDVVLHEELVELASRVHGARDRAKRLIERSISLGMKNAVARGEQRALLAMARHERERCMAARSALTTLTPSRSPTG
jgi:hypothetical protein